MLSIAEVNREIQRLLGDVPLHAYRENGRLMLGDGTNPPAELDDCSQEALRELLYDWAVFVGYTNERFEDFAAMEKGGCYGAKV